MSSIFQKRTNQEQTCTSSTTFLKTFNLQRTSGSTITFCTHLKNLCWAKTILKISIWWNRCGRRMSSSGELFYRIKAPDGISSESNVHWSLISISSKRKSAWSWPNFARWFSSVSWCCKPFGITSRKQTRSTNRSWREDTWMLWSQTCGTEEERDGEVKSTSSIQIFLGGTSVSLH